MSRGLDFERAQAALKRAAEKSMNGTRGSVQGDLGLRSKGGRPIREANVFVTRGSATRANGGNPREWAEARPRPRAVKRGNAMRLGAAVCALAHHQCRENQSNRRVIVGILSS
jgi:hypothetical protein